MNKGGIAEQVVGQLLRTIEPEYIEPALYYWIRHKEGTNAEIDYVIQHSNTIVPIEVKAGKAGILRSLHTFMSLKVASVAVRAYSGLPNITQVRVHDKEGKEISYELRSIPLYLLGEVHRLLNIPSPLQ